MRTLNCKRTARMISLYVAGDLAGAPEREVATHLAACEACRRLAEEFSESSSLLTQACAPPEFGAEFYSEIRQAVLGEIANDQMLAKPSLFRPRWLYATAFAAIVIASVVMLQHFVSARRGVPQDLASAPQVKVRPTSGSTDVPAPRKKQSSGTLRTRKTEAVAFANPHGSSRHLPGMRGSNASAQAAQDRRTEIAPALPSSTNVGAVLVESATLAGSSAASSLSERASVSQVSRIEIQTADPNIRIIWLSPRESREPAENNHDQDPRENGNRK
jgi:hypothetical protein